jgi:hypothetical protein
MHLVLAILTALILFKWLQTGEIWFMLGLTAVGGIFLLFIGAFMGVRPSAPTQADETAGMVMGMVMAVAALGFYGWLAIVLVKKARLQLRRLPRPSLPTG